jgi:hypothetical protein
MPNKYLPELVIRGDIIYWLVYRFGYPQEYVLDVIAEC